MKPNSLFVLALGLCLLGAASRETGAGYAPLLQLTKMTGAVQVFKQKGPRSPGQTRSDKDLPYIFPGSMVEIASGRAEFETDNHVRIEGDAGAIFAFRLIPGGDERPRVLRLDSLGLSAPLYVRVKGTVLRLGTGGSVGIISAGDGEARVVVEEGRVDLAAGSVLHAGEKLTFYPNGPAGLAKGDALDLKVPALFGFSSRPMDMSLMKVAVHYDAGPEEERAVIEYAPLAALPKAPEENREEQASAVQAKPPERAFETRPAAGEDAGFGDMDSLLSAVREAPSQAPAVRIFPTPGVPISEPGSEPQDSTSRPLTSSKMLWGGLFGLTVLLGVGELWRRNRNSDDLG